MFKNHTMQVRMVKEPSATTRPPVQPRASEWTPVTVSALIQEQIQTIIITGTVAYLCKIGADTIHDVLVKRTKQR